MVGTAPFWTAPFWCALWTSNHLAGLNKIRSPRRAGGRRSGDGRWGQFARRVRAHGLQRLRLLNLAESGAGACYQQKMSPRWGWIRFCLGGYNGVAPMALGRGRAGAVLFRVVRVFRG